MSRPDRIIPGVLSNGAEVLRFKDGNNGQPVVLCHWERDAITPWVVWRLDENNEPHTGDYFSDDYDAEDRFKTRW